MFLKRIFFKNFFFGLGSTWPMLLGWTQPPGHWPKPVTHPSHARVKFMRAQNSAKVIKLPSHCSFFVFLQIAKDKDPRYRVQKWRSLSFSFISVFLLFIQTSMHQFLRRKEMSIPGERKPMVVLTSPAVCELCSAARFLLALLFLSLRAAFLCVSISQF